MDNADTDSTTAKIEEALRTATAIAWDGCHKIYVATDHHGADLLRQFGYNKVDSGSELIPVAQTKAGRAKALNILRQWWEESCSLRFISSVSEPADTNDDGFADIIGQFGEWF